MSSTLRVTVVSGPGAIIGALRSFALTTVNPTDLPASPARAVEQLVGSGPRVVVLGPDLALDAALAIADEVARTRPEVEIVLVAATTQQVLAAAMGVGIRQVVAPDGGEHELPAAVERLGAAAELRRDRLATTTDQASSVDGRVITVAAAKGGVGKTTMAVNLAVELARGGPNQTVIVDFDLMAGDVDMVLGVRPLSSIAAIATPGTPLDPGVVKLSLAPHPTGLLILSAPDDLVEADAIDEALLVDVLAILRTSFRFVVVDTAPGAGAALASAVEAADHLIAVATQDLGGLRSLRRNLDGLEALGLTTAQRHLVLNRYDQRNEVDLATVEQTVGLEVEAMVGTSDELTVAANRGEPFALAFPSSPVVRAFRELTSRVIGEQAAPEPTPIRRSATNRGRVA